MIKIVLVDFDEDGKEKLKNLISSHKDLVILGTGKDSYDAIMLAKKFRPDIMLLDASISNDVEISRILKRYSPSTAIVIFNSRVEDRLIQGIINGKITGCLLMGKDMEHLPDILRDIHQGGFYVNSQVSARAFQILADLLNENTPENQPSTEKDPALSEDFSRTEFRILKFLVEGYTSKEIAKFLDVKDGTLRNYISSIMQKTGLKTRTQVVLYALQNGFGKA